MPTVIALALVTILPSAATSAALCRGMLTGLAPRAVIEFVPKPIR